MMNFAQTSAKNTSPPRATDYLIASKRCELLNLERFLQMGKLVLSIGNLIHQLQRERGASNIYLGSGGAQFVDELTAVANQSRQKQQAFEHELSTIQKELTSHPTSTGLLNSIAAALHGLASLSALRQKIREQAVSAEAAVEAYIERIQFLLTVVFEAAETVVDPAIAGILVAMINLMQGKEMAGQERAIGSLGFSRGRFTPALSRRMTHLIEAQERSFSVFEQFADEELRALWKKHNRESYWDDIHRLRGLASSVGRYKTLDPALSGQWFELSTLRIDQLKAIEDTLENHFHRRCVNRYTEARNALAHEQSLTESLDEAGYAPEPVLVVCNILDTDGNANQFEGDGLGQKLGRSLFDLVQQQALRLEQLNDELQQVKEALDDRRVLEKAVVLLMKHQQLSDDEAHRQLRRLAMDQGRKLPDVARSVVAMSGVLLQN